MSDKLKELEKVHGKIQHATESDGCIYYWFADWTIVIQSGENLFLVVGESLEAV